MQIKGYTLVNEEKIRRAIEGSMGQGGKLLNGVGDQDEDAILAKYDQLGGLILKGKRKVKTGSFYDFEKKKPRVEPEVILVLSDLEGNTVEVGEDEEISPELKAAETIQEKKAKQRKEKIEEADAESEEKKDKKKKKKSTEEEE